jgi:pimeloyl-ACP methyl ester carboxylesterase
MSTASILAQHTLIVSLALGIASCEPKPCGEISPDVEKRFVDMRGPLGCDPTDSLIPDPPDGCAGAEELIANARVEYETLWAEGGCGTEPPDLSHRVTGYRKAFAAEHAFIEHRIARDEFTIYAREFGPEHAGKGPTLVLMHGFPDDQHLYDLVAPALGATHHTVTFDFVGWGDSTNPPAGYEYTFDGLLADLEAVVAHFSSAQVVPVVHDASGWPGIDWALAHPESTTALVLLNTAYHPIAGQAPPYVIRALSALDLRQQFIDAVGEDDLMTRALFRAQVGRFFVDEAREKLYLPLFEHDIPRSRAGLFGLTKTLRENLIARAANVPRMRAFPKPVAVAFGAEDPYLNTMVARAFDEVFPNSRLTLIERAGHYVQLDQPEAVVVQIRAAASGAANEEP